MSSKKADVTMPIEPLAVQLKGTGRHNLTEQDLLCMRG